MGTKHWARFQNKTGGIRTPGFLTYMMIREAVPAGPAVDYFLRRRIASAPSPVTPSQAAVAGSGTTAVEKARLSMAK
jgi:hypothetical protein